MLLEYRKGARNSDKDIVLRSSTSKTKFIELAESQMLWGIWTSAKTLGKIFAP